MPLGDPAVDAAMPANGSLVDDPVYGRMASRAQKARSMTAAQRKRSKRDVQGRVKITYELPKSIVEQVQALAAEGGYPPAHLVAILVQRGLADLEAGRLELWRHTVASYVPRYRCFLLLDPDDAE